MAKLMMTGRFKRDVHGFWGDGAGSVSMGLGFNSHSTLMIFHSPLNFATSR
jgi:hypothetical protein